MGPASTRKDTNYRIETLYTRGVTRETRLTAHRSLVRQHVILVVVDEFTIFLIKRASILSAPIDVRFETLETS